MSRRWTPHLLSKKQQAFLHAQAQSGKSIGFKNTADSIYTFYRNKGYSHERAVKAARRTAGTIAVRKGIKSNTRRRHVMRELPART